jgi:hypothetical protein
VIVFSGPVEMVVVLWLRFLSCAPAGSKITKEARTRTINKRDIFRIVNPPMAEQLSHSVSR